MGEATPTAAVTATKLDVEGTSFPASLTPPGSSKTHFLAGAGARGLEIGGRFVVFTAIGVYLEESAVPAIAARWKGKAADELAGSADFFKDVYSGAFEKFTRVSMVLPLTGQQYSEKVAENCVAQWTAAGIYTDAESAAIEKFKDVFRSESFAPGSSILFTQSPTGLLTVAFSKDGSIPEATAAAIENKALAEAVLESIIGERGVSPEAKRSLAMRMWEIMNEAEGVAEVGQAQLVTA
uniref:Chalcone-flavonone isomerase family protein n=1 Tax=Muscari armeniacum TaxID=156613 RepID=A0A220T7Q7_MUSAR|nr:putative chalcone isomerase [Muscari armeniacum]